MIQLNWKGLKGSSEDCYVLISQRISRFKLIGKFTLLRTLNEDLETGGTFRIHIDDSTMRDPFWFISDVYGYINFGDVSLCRVTYSTTKYWAVKLPKGSFSGSETILYDGTEFNAVEWNVVPGQLVIVHDCKTWSASNSNGSIPPPFVENDPIFINHPAFTITQSQINDFHKPVTIFADAPNGLSISSDQILQIALASQTSVGVMSIEDKIRLDTLEELFYPLNENPAGYLTEETDPVFNLSPAKLILSTDIARWNDAYYWGNHANFGYLTSYTETDPIFTNSPSYSIDHGDIALWNLTARSLFKWIEIDVNFTADLNTGYISTNELSRVVMTLPFTNERKSVRIANNAAGGWRVVIPLGITVTFIDTVINDFIESTELYDAIEFVCVDENKYIVISSVGNLNYDMEL